MPGTRSKAPLGHEMAIRDLPSLSVALEPKAEPQKQTSDDGVGMSAKGHKPTFFGDTPTPLLPLLMVGCLGRPISLEAEFKKTSKEDQTGNVLENYSFLFRHRHNHRKRSPRSS